MLIETQVDGERVLMALRGNLTRGEHADALQEQVTDLLLKGHRDFTLDLKGVAYVDSAGLAALVWVHASVSREGGRVELNGLTRRLSDLLRL
jgi:anti-anti-sigma factor